MRVAIAARVLADGDGVGNDALGMGRVLRAAGHAVAYFADVARCGEDVRPLAELSPAAAEALILHHSIRCDAGVSALEAWPAGRAAVKYHNVTPPAFFADYDSAAVADAAAGARQLLRLAKSAAVWVDSPFNGRELEALLPGTSFAVLPPFHQTDLLAAATPDARTAADLDGWPTTFLCVGRVAPNKNLVLAVEAFTAYRAAHDPTARLLIAGEHVYPDYSNAVAARVKELGVEADVTFAGRVTVPQLRALYLAADALLVTSSHEGFCVPLVEAMACGTPVVAVCSTAIPDTAGPAARYADATADALAAGLHAVVGDGPLRESLVLAGYRRYETLFATAVIAARFRELFAGLE